MAESWDHSPSSALAPSACNRSLATRSTSDSRSSANSHISSNFERRVVPKLRSYRNRLPHPSWFSKGGNTNCDAEVKKARRGSNALGLPDQSPGLARHLRFSPLVPLLLPTQ